jgi:acyl-CoA thioester hydrolase
MNQLRRCIHRPAAIALVPILDPPPTCTIDFRVRYAETDQMGVVYHSNYLIWCEVGRTELIRQFGRSYAEIEQLGVGLAVSEASLRFLAPARYDDVIRVTTTLTAIRSRAMTFEYVISHAERAGTLVTAATTLIGLDRDGKVARLPNALRNALGLPDA